MGARGIVLRTIAAACCAAAAGAGFLVASASAGTRPSEQHAQGSDDERDVRDIFLADCATCHGAGARGTDLGPDLRGDGAALVDYVLSTGRMPLSSPHAAVRRHEPKYSPEVRHALVD